MEIFHNRDRPNYDEIVSYGPRWLTEFREMDANYKYAGWTLDLQAYFMERIICNLFPEYADEPTLSMLERLLGIEYDTPNVSLEERRRTVSAYFYGIGKLNRTSIINMAEKYTGCECTVYWKNNLLYVCAVSDLDESIIWNYDYTKLATILRRRMPAHLGIGFRSYFSPIHVVNSEKIRLLNVSYKYGISFWGCRLLDGSWFLDGSCNLDATRRYNLSVGIDSKFSIREPEIIDFQSVKTKLNTITKEYTTAKTVYFFSSKFQACEKLAFKNHSKAKTIETMDNVTVVTKTPDFWLLDGSVALDGSRALNSIYREEAI